jgi:sigma-B regulation protein RsbU (phosphoserine phosphatase)
MAAGVDDFLIKPISPAELGVRLRVAERIGAMQERIAAAGRQLERDLAAAEKLQRGLLPTQTPPGLGIEAAWRFAPCGRVGGDALNLIRLDERHAAFFLLDVVGHGIPAALLAVQVHRLMSPLMSASSLLKRPLHEPPWYEVVPPREVVLGLAGQFRADFDRMEAFTLCYGLLRIDRHELEIANAGHPLILHRRAHGCEPIDMPSLPIGYFPPAQMDPPVRRIHLAPGDALVLASDGLSEAQAADGEDFGVERLCTAVATAAPGAGAIAAAAMAAAAAWQPGPSVDDQTILVLRRPA